MSDNCRSCKAKIEWAITPDGYRIPLDPDPVPDGNIILDYERPEAVTVRPGFLPAAERRLVARTLTKAQLERLRGEALPGLEQRLYKSHYATCPDARRWRRRK